jgi:hypothetical protein
MDGRDFELTLNEKEQKRRRLLDIQEPFLIFSRVPEIKSRLRRYDGDVCTVEGCVMDKIHILYFL